MILKNFHPDFSSSNGDESKPEDEKSNEISEPEALRLIELKRLKIKFYSNVGLNIYDQAQLNKVLKSEKNYSLKRNYFVGTAWRSHAAVRENVFTYLNILKDKFANFTSVLEAIEGELMLSYLADKPIVALTPKLLLGPPGVGKTRFCSELAKALGIPFYSKSLATMTASFVITGMSDGWSDARPGFIATTLLKGCVANPLIMFDEIDKSNAEHRYDTTKPLLTLFEKHSAKYFEDEYFEIEFNASAMNFIATANDENSIPEPVLSRLEVFNIEVPDEAQSRSIIKSIYKEMLAQHPWGKYFSEILSKDIVQYLSKLPPRNVRKLLHSACARSTKRNARPIQLRFSDFETHKLQISKPGIGFLAKR